MQYLPVTDGSELPHSRTMDVTKTRPEMCVRNEVFLTAPVRGDQIRSCLVCSMESIRVTSIERVRDRRVGFSWSEYTALAQISVIKHPLKATITDFKFSPFGIDIGNFEIQLLDLKEYGAVNLNVSALIWKYWRRTNVSLVQNTSRLFERPREGRHDHLQRLE
jgi:hypothetical protein